ncbi:sporulation integral membrane protein YtvI [Paenibacillus sp. J31TS4]|uniref:sporulation integral membrane protein YtvI n=1 Tax=Paenibacillus sp. J31TS4 TaxID=2807195 RepID=UPI001B21A167|nr:sporulation integral membrane protein YtvI [Paenibacillus sp. J31TS4]GIP38082.1 sporulation integral membrane protein YtvI [Paenibacillus sp. J31TS4]
MLAFWKRYYKTILDIALIVFTVYVFMLLFSFLYSIAAPIFYGLVIFLCIEPLAKFLNKRGLPKPIAATISTLLFITVAVGVLVGLGAIFTSQIYNLAQKIPAYQLILQEKILQNADYWQGKIEALPPDLTERAKEWTSAIIAKGSQFVTWFLTGLFHSLSSFSSFMLNVVVGLILAFFLSLEIADWKKLARRNTPETFKKVFQFLRVNVVAGIAGYLKAQLKLVSITFVVIFAALLILRVNNAFSIALLSGVFDLLPLLGVTTVFAPWIIYLFIVGNIKLAVSLSVLLAVVLIARQILEPKITGDSLGVSAFTMLSFMIISLSLFGVAGLIISPILIITIKALMNEGYLKRWIRLPEGEYNRPR